MPFPRKALSARTGHSKGRKEAPRIGLVPSERADIVAPEPPKGLLKTTRKVWDAYWQSPVANAADVNADASRLERWIRCIDELERSWKVFRAERVVAGSHGQPVLNPLGAYIKQLLGEISKAETEMGLTPMARLRLGITYGEHQLTALELNRQLEATNDRELASVDAIEGEWEAV